MLVTLRSEDTGLQRGATTTGEGTAWLVRLPAGTYTLAGVRGGFKTEVVRNVRLDASTHARIALVFKPGNYTEEVVVEADASTLKIGNSVSAVASVLFLGGWWAPLPALQQVGPVGLGAVWLIAKAWALVFVMMWLRWTLPRLRVDQLMHVAWKVLLPISMTLVVVIGGLVMWAPTKNGFPWDRYFGWPLTVGVLLVLFYWMVAARRWSARRVREVAA